MMSPGINIFLVFLVGCSLQLDRTTAQNYGECQTPNRVSGTCVELSKCPELYRLLENPNIAQADRLLLSRSQCGYINNNVLICCPNSAPRTVTSRGSLPTAPQCGVDLTNRIYGGNITGIDEFPWMALIEYSKPANAKGHHCGGALISNRYVVTAAHCVKGRGIPSAWRLSGVRLGEWDTSSDPDCEVDSRGKSECAPNHVDVAVTQAIAHPQYNPDSRNQQHDIALLRLAQVVAFSNFIKPICLPSSANLRSDTFTGTAMDVAGWGKTEKVSASSFKLKATVNVWNLDECRNTYQGQKIGIEPTQMCAGGVEGVDSCRGDSGGPLMVQTSQGNMNYFFLAGVVSFGPSPCGLQGWPGVYTRVGAYVDWIQNTVQA